MEAPLLSRRAMITALLTPPTVTLCKTPTLEGDRTKSFPANHDHHEDEDMKKRACRLCFCKEPWWKNDEEGPLTLTYDLDLVRETLKADMEQCGLDLEEEDCTFCPFCLDKLQGLVQLRRHLDRLQQRLTSMTTGLLTLLSSSSPIPTGEEEEHLVIVKEEVEDSQEDAEAMYILTCVTEGGEDPEERQGLHVLTTEAEGTSSEFRFSCPVCSKTFQKASKLKRHSFVHTKDKPFPCPHCPTTFTQASSVKIHLIKVHRACPLCDKSFQDPTQLQRHVRGCTVRVPCQYCPRTFSHRSYLEQHVKFLHSHSRLVHRKRKRGRGGRDGGRRKRPAAAGPPMEECHRRKDNDEEQETGIDVDLNVEERSTSIPDIGPDLPPHEGSSEGPDFRFPCSNCGKLYRYRWNRDGHALMHTSKRPSSHPCSICSMRFARMDGLVRHVGKVHPHQDEEEGG